MKNLLQKTHLRALMLVALFCAGFSSAWGQSDYSNDYTGNINLSNAGGTSASKCKVIINDNEYNAYKLGTGSSGGSITITVPKETKYLHIHAAGWNGDKTTVAISGGYSGSLSLTSDIGISGNSTTYTLTGDCSNYYKVISFNSALTQDKELTFKTTAGKNRFVIWGITAEAEGGTTPSLTPSDLALTGAPVALTFDLYNNATAKTISYTTSSTGAITVSESEYVTTSVSGNTITVTPVKITPSAQTITISQAADDTYAAGTTSFTVNVSNSAPDYVTLPFEWIGGTGTDLANETGITGNSLGDYAENNAPYRVQFNANGDYIQIKTDSQPGIVTIGVKMIGGGNTSKITVQGSADGTDFIDIQELTISGKQNDILTLSTTNDFAPTHRYVRLSFTKGSNVGVGPISISKPLAVKTPVISLASGNYFEAQNVTISCETDGATIYYTLDGTEPTSASTPYNGAITISETTTLKAIAIKGEDASAVASATYTFPVTYNNIAALVEAAPTETVILTLTDAQVLYVNNKDMYVKDATGAIDFYDCGLEYTAGQILNGTAVVKYTLYKDLPEILEIDTDNSHITSTDGVATPEAVSAANITLANNVCKLVEVKGAYADKAIDGVPVYNKWKIEDFNLDNFSASIATAIGIVVPYNGEPEIALISIEEVPVVAQIGTQKFETLQEAFNAAEAGQTVTLLKDYDATAEPMAGGTRQFVINKSITFDGGGYKLTTKQRGIGIGNVNKDLNDKDNINVTIKNVTVLNTTDGARCIDTRGKIGSLTLEGVTLNTQGATANSDTTQPLTIGGNQADAAMVTITNSTIQTNDEGTAYYAIITFNPVNMTISNSTIKGWANIYAKGKVSSAGSAGSVFNLDKCTLVSSNVYSGVSNAFGAFMVEDNNVTINVTNSEMTLNNSGDQIQAIALYPYGNTLTGNKVTLGEGNKVSFVEPGKFAFVANRGAAEFTISGGLFNVEVPGELCAEGMTIVSNTDEATKDDYPYAIGEADIYYAWKENGALVGEYLLLATPFDKGYLMDGEFITLQKDITLTENIACQLAEGSFNFTLGEYNVTKGDYSISLLPNVSALTDKQTDIFSAAAANCYIEETKTETGYSYTAVEVLLAAPIIFHDGGEYEGALKVAMAGQGTIKYTLNGGAEQTYSAPINVSETTTITAWTESNGVKSDEVSKTFTIVPVMTGSTVETGYYNIKTSEDKYVKVAGRKTVTLVDDPEGQPGTVISVETNDKGQLVELRSQGIDIPSYAEKAMNYVPELATALVQRLGANDVIGQQGADLLVDKFNKEFDYHLYLEKVGDGYRIFGRTPSMKPVVDFYAENKELIDSRLPNLESFVKDILQKIADKMGRGYSLVDMFNIHDIWVAMGGTLTNPEENQTKFYEEVLSSETNVWNFAHETMMIYWDKVKNYVGENFSELGDYGKYLNKVENIRPNFKYYIVPSESGVDFVSEGNTQILNNDANAIWTMTPCDKFIAKLNIKNEKNIVLTTQGQTASYSENYATLYTDFAYTLPETVKAYKITGINKDFNTVEKTMLKGTIPAQTQVLLIGQDVESAELTLVKDDASAPEGVLYGNDWLINKYEMNTPQLETIFALLTKLSSSLGEKYEHLKRLNAGTVNNKYFFGLPVPTEEGDFKEDFMNGKIKVLANGEDGIGFYSNYDSNLVGNEAFMFSEDYNPILLSLRGDVNRDGKISIADVTAVVDIILGNLIYPRDAVYYDFDAANANGDNLISVPDITLLVGIILNNLNNN